MMQKSFYIIDGSACIYRAYYAIRNLSTSNGMPTNAIYGVIQMLLKLIRAKNPDYLVVALDTKGPNFRHALYDAYKANRPPMPYPLSVQIPYIHRLISALGISMISQEGVEADDLIGALAKKGEAAGAMITIVSGDKDLFQLISPHVQVYDTLKEKVFTEEEIRAIFRVLPSQLIEIMGLMGDAVDNVPGVSGIGKKTAIDLIAQFGTIEGLLSNLDAVKKISLRETLRKEAASARLSRELVTLKTDCLTDIDLNKFQIFPHHSTQLLPLLEELEFSSLVKEFSAGTVTSNGPIPHPESDSHGKIGQGASPAGEGDRRLGQDKPYPALGLMAIEIMFHEGREYLSISVAPTADCIPSSFSLDSKTIPSNIRDFFESDQMLKVGHDLKRLLHFLNQRGVTLRGPFFDTLIAAYLIDPSRREYPLETLIKSHLQVAESSPTSSFPPLFQVVTPLQILLHDAGLLSLFTDIEMPLVAVLADMEQTGVKIDVVRLSQIASELSENLVARSARIYSLAGKEFNINSPKQLGHILFEVLNLPPLRKTKTGYSTDEEVLTQLAIQHDLPAEILLHRQEMKLKSTYVDALPQCIRPGSSRVHTHFNQAGTATGRLSSSDPNLQNIPVKGEWGQKIREAFIVDSGCALLVADYNQIELRILAHLSGDPALTEAFRQGDDIHLQTAIEIFGLPKESITKEMRRAGKTVNFGIIYGISPFGLAANLSILQSEAKRYIDLYFARYKGVKRFIEGTIVDADQKGYVTTLLGRRRAIPELADRNRKMREAGERLAVNTVIQGTAADMIKLAMIDIFHWMKAGHLKSKMILQVHDELLFEVPHDEMALMREEVVTRMEAVMALHVPLKVDVGAGENWRAAKG